MSSNLHEQLEASKSRRCQIVSTIVVFASIFVFGLVSDPVPGINEPHYLTKAKHYWNVEWCEGDFFLESSNPHRVFYQTIGLLTRLTNLEQAAWIGRALAYALLAFGWTSLVRQLSAADWAGVWSAWIFLTIAAIGNLSGEWLIGGIESKVVSYGFVFWGLALLLGNKRRRAAALFGASISFHPVVGIWSTLAAVMAIGISQFIGSKAVADLNSSSPRRKRFQQPIICGTIGLICSLPGLIPALQLLRGNSGEIEYEANYIQVFYRLTHHLDPTDFPVSAYILYLVLAIVWFGTHRLRRPSEPSRLFFWFVVAAMAIAVVGLVIGFHIREPVDMWFFRTRMKLMKFYPFRLFDVVMPLAVSISVASLLQDWSTGPDAKTRTRRRVVGWIVLASVFATCIVYRATTEPSAATKRRRDRDWIAACEWISENTPADALFLTPRSNKNFKWYADRAEYVSHKDCPQDAPGIVEWNRRLNYVRNWAKTSFDDGYSQAAVLELLRKTGITHMIPDPKLGPFKFPTIYRNDSYRVYRIK